MNKALSIFIFMVSFLVAVQSKAQNNEKTEQTLSKKYTEKMTDLIGGVSEAATNKMGEMMDFAKSFLGVKYRYGSSNPKYGFDCSGFVTYVFKQFGYNDGARSSRDYAAKGKKIPLEEAKVGDVLVFTGTNTKKRVAGHVGIIYSIDEDGKIKFIHSSSGQAHGVTITDLEGYYQKRLLKAVSMTE